MLSQSPSDPSVFVVTIHRRFTDESNVVIGEMFALTSHPIDKVDDSVLRSFGCIYDSILV